jgi:excinuclease ABC subunit A
VLEELTAASRTQQTESLKLYVTFPLPLHEKESVEQAIVNIKKEGFFRVLVNAEIVNVNIAELPKGTKASDVQVLVDRLVFKVGDENTRIADSIETAFASGGGNAEVFVLENGNVLKFNQNFECSHCRIKYEEPDPRLFSFNNPFGACPECQGFGRAMGIDMDLVVPIKSKTLREDAVQPWSTPKFREHQRRMVSVARRAGLRLDVPFSELTETELKTVTEGFEDFEGINGFFKMLEKKSYKIYYRVLLSRYRGYTTCPVCEGARLRKEALHIKVGEHRISNIVRMTIAEASKLFQSLSLTKYEQEIAKRIFEELRRRLTYLNEVGIGYLTLDRLSSTLSGGESQRINLATSLGSSLVGALYVLDEPSIGLHPRDNDRLIRILKALRDVGNTVLVVEHDADMMRASDIIVDLGPRAGEFGGEVVYSGSSREIVTDHKSLTGKYLNGRLSIPVPRYRRESNSAAIRVHGARENNLKNIDVMIPLNTFVCITGVSGSGKSTLVHDVLFSGLKRLKGEPVERVGSCAAILGHEHVSSVEMVDQSPIGRTPRSNPVTYIQVFDQIRNLFANMQAAKIHGFTPGHFSFNVPGGRCEACEGDGVVKVEMQFLADLYLMCDVCKGARYKKEVLDVQYHGKNITDVLGMTVSGAIQFFNADATGRKVAQRLKVLEDVGLGYIRLGQSATSLSGGEAQRIKLAAHLSAPGRDMHTLFIFDEPTTGLHFDDIAKLLTCFSALIDQGHSVLIIEHNLDVIKCADYVIDLGPEAGEEGGRVVGTGTPEQIAQLSESHTGGFLRTYFAEQKLPK